MIAVRVRGLRFSYREGFALRDISMEVRGGEVLGLLGPNGAGKTTLLRCLAGLLRPFGAVYLDGRRLSEMSARELARLVSYVSAEDGAGWNGLMVFDVVAAGRTPHMKGIWWESEEDERVVEEAMRSVDVIEFSERRVNELSSGERQKVRIARALAQNPRILLVDEPTAHLDLKNQVEIMEILRRLARREVAVVAALHDLNLASAFADRIVMMKNGEIMASGEPRKYLRKSSSKKSME